MSVRKYYSGNKDERKIFFFPAQKYTHVPIIPTPERQKQHRFKVILGHAESLSSGWFTWIPVSTQNSIARHKRHHAAQAHMRSQRKEVSWELCVSVCSQMTFHPPWDSSLTLGRNSTDTKKPVCSSPGEMWSKHRFRCYKGAQNKNTQKT